jgi:DNA-binding SARP family transcriptional activator
MQDSWVLGFVTAEETVVPAKRYKNPDNAALIAWISNYCAKSPLSQIALASFALTQELRNDPADAKLYEDVMRNVYRRNCAEGDRDACEVLKKNDEKR